MLPFCDEKAFSSQKGSETEPPPPLSPQPGVSDMVHLLSKLQDSAVDSASQLSTTHRVSLHAITAGILHLLCHISTVPALTEHVLEVVQRRSETAPLLLPDQLFTAEREEGADGAEGRGDIPTRVGEDLLFHLRERGLVRQSPEPTMDPTSKRCMYKLSGKKFLPQIIQRCRQAIFVWHVICRHFANRGVFTESSLYTLYSV